jgi:hypothetical protein
MKIYRVKGNTPFGEIDIEIPRSEIIASKKRIRADGKFGYSEMTRLMSHPAAVVRYCMVPRTNVLRWVLKSCIIGGRLLILVAVALLFVRLWWWSLGLGVFHFLVLYPIQAMLNYEIGARLFALDMRLMEIDKLAEQRAEGDTVNRTP